MYCGWMSGPSSAIHVRAGDRPVQMHPFTQRSISRANLFSHFFVGDCHCAPHLSLGTVRIFMNLIRLLRFPLQAFLILVSSLRTFTSKLLLRICVPPEVNAWVRDKVCLEPIEFPIHMSVQHKLLYHRFRLFELVTGMEV